MEDYMTKDEELNIINSDCSSKTYETLASEFNLNKEQIRYIFKKHNIKKKRSFSKLSDLSDIAILDLENNYNNHSISYFSKKYNTSEKVILNFFKKNNIKKSKVISYPKEDNWTSDELEILKNNYQTLTNLELLKLLPNRTNKALSKKMYSLKYIRVPLWSQKEDEILKRYINLNLNALSFLLERSKKSIQHRIDFLGLEKNKEYKTNIEIIIENILLKYNIDYKYNEMLGNLFKFRPDFVIENSKLIIECQGDYYHANPEFYSDDDLNELQKISREKDKIKKEYYDSLGYTSLFLWENDILNDIENIENYIKTLCQGPS